MRSPQMMGDDCPLPGSGVFQATSASDHFTGSVVSVVWPFSAGPRQRGQACAGSDGASGRTAANDSTRLESHIAAGIGGFLAGAGVGNAVGATWPAVCKYPGF